MRTILILGSLTVAAFAQANIPFRTDLTCGSCVIGGYSFCYAGNIAKCCEPTDTPCKTGNTCTEVADQFKALYDNNGACQRGNFRPASCGNNGVIQIKNSTEKTTFNVT